MRTVILCFFVFCILSGCTSLRPVSDSLSSSEVDDAKIKEFEHQQFIRYSERYLKAMQEPLALTNGLFDDETAWRFMFMSSCIRDPVICVRINSFYGRDAVMTVKVMTQRIQDMTYVPGRLIYSCQEILSQKEFDNFCNIVPGLAAWQAESMTLAKLDGAIYSIEEATGQGSYHITMRNTPDPDKFQALVRNKEIADMLRKNEPLFNILWEIEVQRRFVKMIKWHADKTGLWSLSQNYK